MALSPHEDPTGLSALLPCPRSVAPLSMRTAVSNPFWEVTLVPMACLTLGEVAVGTGGACQGGHWGCKSFGRRYSSSEEEQIETHQTQFPQTMRHPTDKSIPLELARAVFKLAPSGERLYCANRSPSCTVPINTVFN